MNKVDCVIFFSNEDDKYRVLGGIGTYIGLLSKQIRKYYPRVDVYWVSQSPSKKEFEEIDDFGVRRYYFNASHGIKKVKWLNLENIELLNLLGKLAFSRKVTDKVYEILEKNEGKNIIIESGEWEGLGHEIFSNVRKKNIAKIVRLHTPLATCIKQNSLDITPANLYQLMVEYYTIINADCISACTNFVRDNVYADILKGSNRKSIVVLPNPVDISNFLPNQYDRSKAIQLINSRLKENFLTENTFNIFVIGSVESRKGVEYLVDAVPIICKKIPNARVCFIGHCGKDGVKNFNANTKLSPTKLYARIPKKYWKFIKFTDYVAHEHLPMVMEAGDIFPILSVGDNFPGTVAEISLKSKPIIALERGGVREMLSDGGKFCAYSIGQSINGVPNKLAKAVYFLYKHPKERIKIGCDLRKLIIKKYNPETTTKKIMALYSRYLS